MQWLPLCDQNACIAKPRNHFKHLLMMLCGSAGMLAVALTPTLQLAAVCSAYLYSMFNLFAGFSMTQPNMPGWW